MAKKYSLNLIREKRGLSNIVIMIVAIALVISLGAVIITNTEGIIRERTEQASSCGPDLIGKLSINSEWTCYDPNQDLLNVQIAREDVEIDELTISVSTEGQSYQFDLNSTPSQPSDENKQLYHYNSSGTTSGTAVLLNKSSEKNYMISGLGEKPQRIRIAPTVNDNQCEVMDTLNTIPDCSQVQGIFN